MSRIGRLPVTLPKGVTFAVAGSSLTAKGPKGTLSCAMPSHVGVDVVDGAVKVTRVNDSKPARARHGLTRSLIQNLVTGVSEGFERKLQIVGVGYKADVQGSTLNLHLGYSHPINYPFPDGIQVQVQKDLITVTGIDKELLGQTAANIRGFRKPDAYKGKGVRLKAGKSGK